MLPYYLRFDIKAEPLIWKWYAWPHLIPPATAACNIVERHLKIMYSYIESPQIHSQAIKDPKMLGGPFIDFETEATDAINELAKMTEIECKNLIELNSAIKKIDRILQLQAKGDCLEDLYQQIPHCLKGCVELVYNLNHHPSLRLIEPLLYKLYYNTSYQSIALSHMVSDHRKFVLSTPRLNQNNEVSLNIPFSDPKLDIFFRMKDEPMDSIKLKNLFSIPIEKQKLYNSFFTVKPPSNSSTKNFQGDGIRLRYFGHACVLIQTKEISILFDPVISYSNKKSVVPRYSFEDLPDKIDYVIITHNHQDHLMFETLLQLRYKIGHIIFPTNNKGALEDPSIKLILKNTGFSSLIEVEELEKILLPNGEIIALPFLGEHSDLNIHSKLSFCIKLKGKNFMFAADSNNLDSYLYKHISEVIGPVEMLFLGMECDGAPLSWLYGPYLSSPISRGFDRKRTLSGSNFKKAWAIVEKISCKSAYIYAMGQEPWLNHIMALHYEANSPQIIESNKFIEACRCEGIESERLFGKKEWVINS